MKKISKNLISTFFCSTMALGLMFGLTNVTSSKMVQANASPITKTNDISHEVYRPYDLTLTTDSIIFKEDVNVSDNVTRWDMFILAGSSGETAPIRVDINEFDAEGFKLYDGYCIKANGASEDPLNPGGTFQKLDDDTFEITIIPSKINGVKFLGDDKPYIWLVVAPCDPFNRLDQTKGTSGHFDVYNSTICLGKFGSLDNFKTVATLVTIADILPAHFPIRTGDVPENAWVNENGAYLYVMSANEKISFDGSGISAGGFMLHVGTTVTASDDNYTCPGLNGNGTITFKMSNGKLASVVLTGYESKGVLTKTNGEFLGTIVHTLEETHNKVEPTCTVAGHEAYYECDCGAFFSDSDLTQEIPDLETWLGEGGGGYIAPEHNFGEVTYTWVGNQCTASRTCQREGCEETQTETSTGVYVKDRDATTKSNEKGHYEATFENSNFTKQVTEPNSVEKENTKLPGLNGGAIAGICVGCLFFLLLVIYLIGYFFFYRKGKLDEKKIKVIYKFLPRGKKNLKENEE